MYTSVAVQGRVKVGDAMKPVVFGLGTTPPGSGPIGPTEQLPLVARLVNALDLNLSHAHFWGMDEWLVDGKEAPIDFPLSFAKADMDFCFNRIRPELRMPMENIHFPQADTRAYTASYDQARCVVMQGGQGDVKHWAFNDPPKRIGKYKDHPPSPAACASVAVNSTNCNPARGIANRAKARLLAVALRSSIAPGSCGIAGEKPPVDVTSTPT